ncbi:acetyltransferase [Flavobacterium sp. JP2137]|uniref:acetyltransferase n=1 Tax=Flavobacterium sp. JP2137 TaxID=3414510 RepID=UPI003D300587
MGIWLIYGKGGHARVVADAILKEQATAVIHYFDDAEFPYNSSFESESPIVIAIGNNSVREKIAKELKHAVATVIHPSAQIASEVIIGEGTVVLANAVIQTGCIIGKHCIINANATIDHDCKLSDYVHISPNVALAGNVVVKEGTHIGIGACVLQGIHIGKWATIGAGAVVTTNVPDYAVVVGNPGRIIKYNSL